VECFDDDGDDDDNKVGVRLVEVPPSSGDADFLVVALRGLFSAE
jgi:hypothetical protein